jgi:glycosyltransferase involved in cell wall biosynthesis
MPDRRTLEVSLVCTMLNEVTTVSDLMGSIAAQTVRPREVIIVDGGSRDGTQLHVEWWHGRLGCPLRLIELPGTTIAMGRNAAIAAARFPIIAVTDAGVRLDPRWLEAIIMPFEDETVAASAGFFVADPRGAFEIAMGATVLPQSDEIDPATFLPSSRSLAVRKAAWERVGGYPEWLDYCEDVVFDLALRKANQRVAFAPDAIAHFRPRATLRAFWHQYFRYARGDGKAGLWPKRHAIRYVTYSGVLGLLLLGKRGAPAWPLMLAGAGCYLRQPYIRLKPLLPALSTTQRAGVIALVPLIRAIGDVAKMCGYPVGLTQRLRYRGFGWTWRDARVAPSDASATTNGTRHSR